MNQIFKPRQTNLSMGRDVKGDEREDRQKYWEEKIDRKIGGKMGGKLKRR